MMQFPNRLPRIIVLISGRGSNLNALIENANAGKLRANIVGVISNRKNAPGLKFARAAGIPAVVVERQAFAEKSEFDSCLLQAIDEFQPDLIVLAGFMQILATELVNRHAGKILNVHPSLLPKYRGLNTYQRALQSGDDYHGTSVHFVTPELDSGPVVLQVRIPVRGGDDESSLADRVQACEHVVYSDVVNWFADGRLDFSNGRALLDGKQLLEPVTMDEAEVLGRQCDENR